MYHLIEVSIDLGSLSGSSFINLLSGFILLPFELFQELLLLSYSCGLGKFHLTNKLVLAFSIFNSSFGFIFLNFKFTDPSLELIDLICLLVFVLLYLNHSFYVQSRPKSDVKRIHFRLKEERGC